MKESKSLSRLFRIAILAQFVIILLNGMTHSYGQDTSGIGSSENFALYFDIQSDHRLLDYENLFESDAFSVGERINYAGKNMIKNSFPEDSPEKNFTFGFLIGLNTMGLFAVLDENHQKNGLESISQTWGVGAKIGLVLNARINQRYDLAFYPGLFFSGTTTEYYFSDEVMGGRRLIGNQEIEDIVLPILLRYKLNKSLNRAPYLTGGFRLNFGIKDPVRQDEVYSLAFWPKRYSLQGMAGIGFERATEYITWGMELTGSFGVINMINKDLWAGVNPGFDNRIYIIANNLNKVYPASVMLTFIFK